ncbi:hypothetical protein GCM10011608_11410 [Micromonospora sonchi]|uniref:Uncharacterized protein n=1 Tax=Micromonospora sonchi TaxID=1763543 RepID=A0A917WTX5_9ACTN|nr:hypothetical protein [Micromonospora sonchi]GGM28309.1 hypothetical protein GCM10011608_11410 [Micromonospora sonchi]
MPKKRTPRQRRAAQQRARLQQRQDVARQEEFHEEHARLVLDRMGDPRFVQRTTGADGVATLTWDAGSQAGTELREGFQAQFAAFREKFGREPGPKDPVFFDPDADEPTPLSQRSFDDAVDHMLKAAEDAGVDQAPIHAWREVGYLVTEENQHLFSAAEVQAYADAVTRHRGDIEDIDLASTVELSADGLRDLIDETITSGMEEPAWRLGAALDHADDPDAAGLAATTLTAVLMTWLTSAKATATTDLASPALGWIRQNLDDEPADQAFQLAGLLGSPLAPNLTVNEALDRLGDAFLPALIWLVAGLVATEANGDVEWLTQFDPDIDQDDE